MVVGPVTPLGPIAAGSKIGPYEVLGHLATGGMGDVYLGRKTGIGGFERTVVVKVLLAHLARDERFAQMFVDEARIVSRLSHPNIVQVFDLDRANGVLYLAMEHLHGQSAASCLKVAAHARALIPIEIVARVICDVASGLAHAHAAKDTRGGVLGLVHRDVSPENIFLTYDGPTKVLDFGVAKIRGRIQQTQEGEFKGKVAYMAPEIVLGRAVDARADLFSLGVVMFEMLVTRRLFHAPNPATTLHRVLSEPIPDVRALRSEVDGELAMLCASLLEREPARRVQTAEEVEKRLETWLAQRGFTTKHVGLWLRETFKDALAVSERIAIAAERTGQIDPDDIVRAKKLGGADIGDDAVSELSSEERSIYAKVDETSGGDFGEPQDTAWIMRAKVGRWALGLLAAFAIGLGVHTLLERGIDADRLHIPRAKDAIADRYVVEEVVYESARSSLLRASDIRAKNAATLLWISDRVAGREAALVTAIRVAAERIDRARHPSIPEVHDVGMVGDRVYAAMGWYEGRTLAAMLEREHVPAKRARRMLVQLADAFADASRAGLVHGLLEPSLIIVDRDDQLVIAGFTMGFEFSGAARDDSPYHAPDPKPTHAADQFALGIVTSEVLRAWDQEGSVSAAGVVARATLANPADRYESIERFAKELESALGTTRRRRR